MVAARTWKYLILLLGLLLMPAGLFAQDPLVITGAEAMLQRADALALEGKNYDGAITLLRHGIEQYPTYTRLYERLAVWQEFRGLHRIPNPGGATPDERTKSAKTLLRRDLSRYPEVTKDLFNTYGLAMMYATDPRALVAQAAELTTQDFPLQIGEFGPLALPGDPIPFFYTVRDPQLPEGRGTYQGLVTTRPLTVPRRPDNRYSKDPKSGEWLFQRMLLAYEYDREQRCWWLRFRVMWQDVPGQADNRARLAQQVAQMLLRISGLARLYAGVTPRFAGDGVVNVWLAEKGQPGGEAYNDSIYLYQVSVPRSPGEWIRELAHEYGHQTLPAVGGYTKPEWGANGRLGERLFLRWLLRNLDPATEAHPWVQGLNPQDAKETRIDRLVRQFAKLGPEMPAMSDTDSAAMDAFVGMALYLDETRGSRLLSDALKAMTSPTYGGPMGFLESVQTREAYRQSADQASVLLTLSDVPKDVLQWVYLTKGSWQGTIRLRNDATAAIKVEVDGVPCRLDDGATFTTTALKEGWHRIKLTGEGETSPDFESLRLVRQ